MVVFYLGTIYYIYIVSMKKLLPLLAVSLVISTMTTGCRKRSVIGQDIKDSFNYVREETDDVNIALSRYSQEIEETRTRSIKRDPYAENTSNAYITDAVMSEFLAEEFFGLYIFSCVNYAVQYCYEPNGIEYGDKIHASVTNELNERYREFLKSHNGTTNFYFQLDKQDNDLVFHVDWKREHNVRNVPDSPDYHGCVYVDGLIKRDEDNNVTDLYISDYLTSYSHHISSSHYDFVNKKMCLLTERHANSDNTYDYLSIAEQYNDGELTYQKAKEERFTRILVATADMEDDYLDVNYEGYLMNINASEDEDVSFDYGEVTESQFEEKYNEVYNSLYEFPLRYSNDELAYRKYKNVNFMDQALGYGLAKTKLFIDSKGAVHMGYIEKEELLSQIEEYKSQNELDENTISSLNALAGSILSISEENYFTVFENNNYFFDTVDASNYWHNAYKCEEFYFIFGGAALTGVLLLFENGKEITDAQYNIKHRYDGVNGAYYYTLKYKEVEDTPYLYGTYIRTTTEVYYAICDDCGEEVPFRKFLRKEIVYLGDGLDGEGNTEIIESVGCIYSVSYDYNFTLCMFKATGGGKTEYIYVEELNEWMCTYNAQLECNENTNYVLYPMYEYYYDYQVNKDGDEIVVSFISYWQNNWLHWSDIEKETEIRISQVDDMKLHFDINEKIYGMDNGVVYINTEYIYSMDAEYMMVDYFDEPTLSICQYTETSKSYIKGELYSEYSSGQYYEYFYQCDEANNIIETVVRYYDDDGDGVLDDHNHDGEPDSYIDRNFLEEPERFLGPISDISMEHEYLEVLANREINKLLNK